MNTKRKIQSDGFRDLLNNYSKEFQIVVLSYFQSLKEEKFEAGRNKKNLSRGCK
jgi:hypothetical protein